MCLVLVYCCISKSLGIEFLEKLTGFSWTSLKDILFILHLSFIWPKKGAFSLENALKKNHLNNKISQEPHEKYFRSLRTQKVSKLRSFNMNRGFRINNYLFWKNRELNEKMERQRLRSGSSWLKKHRKKSWCGWSQKLYSWI